MSTQSHYDQWSAQYDTNDNKTRDLEAVALRKLATEFNFHSVLEMGAGTGKNTVWYAQWAEAIVAVDLSAEMLAKAKEKIDALDNPLCATEFVQADITQPWNFGEDKFDLVSFSLVLEHIEDLDFVFGEVAKALQFEGHVYIGELHPFKQYTGSKARFETAEGEVVVQCYNHHVSDFVGAARRHELQFVAMEEFFDGDDRSGVPRILGMVFRLG
jgi:ubiquinone/menaquinone biosynthesis C-methylase UbiE